jgi:hypothetical protein
MKKAGLLAVLLVLTAAVLLAVSPQKWQVRTMDDVLKGKSRGLSVSSEGELFLAPAEEAVEGPAEEFYLSLASGPDGALYLGTGHSGRVYRVPKTGKPELFFQAPEMDVTALGVGADGTLFVGTSPNGKIYKVKEKNKGEVFFDPGEKYIWSLLPGESGSLLAAVGESGGVYEISSEGNAREILKVAENHILCLKRDKAGVLWAGSGGNGLLYQYKNGKAFVVFESPFEEVKSIDFDAVGNILVGASGTPSKGKKEEVPLAAAATTPEVEITVVPTKAPAPEPAASPASSALAAGSIGREPSGLFVVSPAGEARKIWGSTEEMIYAVLWREADKRVLVGTGPQGRLYAVTEDEKASLLVQKPSEQVYALQPVESRVYVVCDNPPRLDALLPEQRFEGDYESAVQDAKLLATWGAVSWQSELPQGTTLQLETRSGNSSEPGPTWSEWSPPYQNKEGEPILSPRARFLQFRALFKTDSGRVSPRLRKIVLNYIQANVAPSVREVGVLAPNVVLLKPPDSEDVIWGAAKTVGQPAAEPGEKEEQGLKALALAKKALRKGLQTVVWEAVDENGDELSYTLQARKEGESVFHVLEDDWKEILYAFDTSAFSDGVYRLKIIASDAPANPPGTALTGDKESGPLTVDNTAPVIKNVTAVRSQNTLKVTFDAEDNLSPIVEARYFIRPGDWRAIFPVDGIADSRKESFNLSLPLPPNPDSLIIVEIKDSHGNVGVYRQAF